MKRWRGTNDHRSGRSGSCWIDPSKATRSAAKMTMTLPFRLPHLGTDAVRYLPSPHYQQNCRNGLFSCYWVIQIELRDRHDGGALRDQRAPTKERKSSCDDKNMNRAAVTSGKVDMEVEGKSKGVAARGGRRKASVRHNRTTLCRQASRQAETYQEKRWPGRRDSAFTASLTAQQHPLLESSRGHHIS